MKNAKSPGKVATPAVPQLTPEQLQHLREQGKYWEKKGEFNKTHETRSFAAIDAIHSFYDEARWFAEHTPHAFKTTHSTPITNLAGLSCRYLQDLARRGNEDSIRELARLAVSLTETVDNLLSTPNPSILENVRPIAEKLPYWPTLVYRHGIPRRRFTDIADMLRLGAKCPLNVTKSAKYAVQTPINRLVWGLLRHFNEVHDIIARGEHDKKTVEETMRSYIWRNETKIYKRSYKLKSLTKANAALWADKAILPLLQARYADFSAVPILKRILDKCDPRPKSPKAELTAIRKTVIQSLQSLAPAKLDKIRFS